MSTSDIHHHIHHLAAAYALDAVDADERAAFEAHYPDCDVCRADVVDLREALAVVASSGAVAPPVGLEQRVMAEIAQTRQLSPHVPGRATRSATQRRRRQITTAVLAAAAVIVLVVAVAVVMRPDAEPSYARALSEVMEQPDAGMLTLDAMAGDPGGMVRVAWSQDAGRAVVMADALDAAPDGMAYELWMVGDAGPVPMSMLDRAGGGEIHRVIDGVHAAPTAWGVTMEPVAGSPTPGEILYWAEA